MRQSQGRRRLHVALFLGVGLGATGLGLVAYGTNVFRTLELRTVDTRLRSAGTLLHLGTSSWSRSTTSPSTG